MAISIDTQDIDQYPGNVKRITVDQAKIVPTGFEGDEQFVVTVATTAYSDNATNTAIQNLYISDFDIGWAKSSGLTGSAGKFALDATHNTMKVKMDNTISGSDGNGYYSITLDYGATPRSGELIAADMEEKIRGITCVTADAGYQLAYTNCSVEFKESKFWIYSGTISRSYTGTYKSAVALSSGTTNDCSSLLGFSNPVTSENIAGQSVAESLLTTTYSGGTDTVSIGTGTGVATGDACAITDGTNTEYFTVLNVSSGDLTVAVSGTNGFDAISNTYTTADYSRVQIVKMQDPDIQPSMYCGSVDDLIRFGVKCIINQIDYSS